MTAAELALMGYQPGQTSSPDLQAAQSSVTPQDLQQFYAMAGNPAAGTPDASQLNPPPAFIDPAILNAVSSLPPSDPNGLTSTPTGSSVPFPQATPYDSTNPADDPRVPSPAPGQNPSSPDATYETGVAAVSQSSQRNPQQSATAPAAAANQNIAQALGFPQLADWAKAAGLPRQVMPDERKVILEKYLDQQKDFLARQDPEKLLKLKKDQVELQKSTMEQSDAVNKKIDAVPKVQNNIKLLDDLLAHKGLSSAVGAKDGSFLWGMKKEPMAGTEAANFMARMEQVQGLNFLEAFNQLKGAGQITEIEGDKATKALGRLGTNQSESEFRNSVAELRGILQTGLDRSKARLGTQAPSDTATTAPSPAPATAPVIKAIPGRGTFQSLGNGQWKQIQ
jgi:hypothetical protein